MTQEEKGRCIVKEETTSLNDTRIVAFKEGYLDNLIEAEALLEIMANMISRYDDIQMNTKALMGMSILLEKISQLIDVNENLISDCAVAANTAVPQKRVS